MVAEPGSLASIDNCLASVTASITGLLAQSTGVFTLGATVLELFTYRADAHSTSDDPTKYRPKTEFDRWPLGDPIERLKQHLIGKGEWDEDRHAKLEEQMTALVVKSYKEAESHGTLHEGPLSPTESIFEDVYAKPDWRLRRQRQDLGV